MRLRFWRKQEAPRPPHQPFEYVDHYPYFRFRCNSCGAEKDQGLRKAEANEIKCICGESATKLFAVADKEKPRWVDANGNPVGRLATENNEMVEAIYERVGGS